MFQELDENKDGYIDYEEMRRFASLTGDPEIDIDDWTRITHYFSCNPDLGLRLADLYEMYLEPESAKLFEVDLNRDYEMVLKSSERDVVATMIKQHESNLNRNNIPSIESSSERVESALSSFEKTSAKPCLEAFGTIKRVREEIQSRSKARQKKDGERTPRTPRK